MKNYKLILLLVVLAAFTFSACDDYVTSVDSLIDRVEDGKLTDEAQVDFLIIGVKTQFSDYLDNMLVVADGLSDQFLFDQNVHNATYLSFEDIDNGEILLTNTSLAYTNFQRARKHADLLVERVNEITFSDDNQAKKQEGLYIGHLYAGYTRYCLATYYGQNLNQGGSPIDVSAFIPSSQLYADAVTHFESAISNTSDAAQIRVLNSLIARVYLYSQDYANAASFAAKGMVEGDAPFTAEYNLEIDNYYRQQAGRLRPQYVLDDRIINYVANDPEEEKRIKFEVAPLIDEAGTIRYRQIKYPDQDSPIPLMTWQENNLMVAEAIVRGNSSGDAAALINAIRASYGMTSTVTTVDQNVIIAERDKELLVQGARLPDQRRFGIFHLGADKWNRIAIPEGEYLSNPNMDLP